MGVEGILKEFQDLNSEDKLKVFNEINQFMLEKELDGPAKSYHNLFNFIEHILDKLVQPKNDAAFEKANRVRKRLSIHLEDASEEPKTKIRLLFFIAQILYLFMNIKRSDDGLYCVSFEDEILDPNFKAYEEIDHILAIKNENVNKLMENTYYNLKNVMDQLQEQLKEHKKIKTKYSMRLSVRATEKVVMQ
ncbi:hypothetical protein [Neobacillus rhizophilus]|uniref:Uncharacterized protein n=1 Tax=Neobacillus rhizophilus TaxID=2833579 RepID=A0A942U390_9BACI|nr:hypothetical protein [Neobacillus rhizophilus]MBS4211616.1 hypothetical protein [Neobacillus rhizophilus]